MFSTSNISKKLTYRKYYNELIDLIKINLNNTYKIIVAPGPDEIEQAKQINADCILDNGIYFYINISQLYNR